MRMLEYDAGTGLVTQALRDSVGPVTLADTSTGMREVVHAKIAAGALTDARDGCHLTRRPADLVRGAGFAIERVESRYAAGPKPWTWLTEGAAIKPR